MKKRLAFATALWLHLSLITTLVAQLSVPFKSAAVDSCVAQVAARLANPRLTQMFRQCFPNTLETTVNYRCLADGDDDTFVITGDIPAMWLRDAAAQVWPYLRFVKEDEALRRLVRGVVRRQLRSLLIDPYANAFCESSDSVSPLWAKDYTEMRPGVFERKYELDSQCYPLRLACGYWQATGDASIFDALWYDAVALVIKTMQCQQRVDGMATYRFMRTTHAMHDTRSNYGVGHPARPCGLVASAFRPSDDCTLFPYNIPGNIMARSVLRQTAAVMTDVGSASAMQLAAQCRALANDIDHGLQAYATVHHPRYGTIYAYEVDGYGSALLMDDANIPSLLSLPYIADVSVADSIYQNTRRFVLSGDNPYYFSGTAGRGIGGPHVGLGYVWPMSIIMQAMTSYDNAEVADCLRQLLATDAGTGYMHEAFYKDDATRFTRSWFAWCNTLFGELVLHMLDTGRQDVFEAL